MKHIPIGIESFKELIDGEYYYVDKALFTKDVCKEKAALYTRPRRFGETLSMNMLYYFFPLKQKENAYLSDGLYITKDAEILRYQNQYPVIFIILKGVRQVSFENQEAMFATLVQEIVRNNKELLDSEEVSISDKEQFVAYSRCTQSDVDLQNALKFLRVCLKQHYHKNVTLLIDEYGVLLQSTYPNGYCDEMADFLSGIFSAVLKTNDALEKGILTGCLRIVKESIFTGLSNFNVYSITEEPSNTCFGFIPEEILRLLEYYRLKSYGQIVKEWYDGYLFGNKEIYDPWSVLKYVLEILQGNDAPESFWANTSGNDIIYQYIQEADSQMRTDFDTLTSGERITQTVRYELTYREMDQINNIYSLLLFAGYLKAITCVDKDKAVYQLMIPNREINRICTLISEEWFQKQVKTKSRTLVDVFMKGDVETANEVLSTTLFESISYFDYDEKLYHGVLVGMLGDYQIVSNQETGNGRSDIMVLPAYKKERGLVFEAKVATKGKGIEITAQRACHQIKGMNYIDGLQERGYTDIIGYGTTFYEKTCVIMLAKQDAQIYKN